jgi:hypothetical protein
LHTPEDCYALTKEGFLYSAFNIVEPREMLPRSIMSEKVDLGNGGKLEWTSSFYGDAYGEAYQRADTEADVRAKMLIYLLENHLIG